MTEVVMDFETANRGGVSVGAVGSDAYAAHKDTEILCLGFAVGDKEPLIWHPVDPSDCLVTEAYLRRWVDDADAMFIAHNVAFEKSTWRQIMMPRYGFPDIPNERWHDTMAACAERQLPLGLEAVAKVLGLPPKDKVGSMLTVSLSKPDKRKVITQVIDGQRRRLPNPTFGQFDRSPETMARVYEYCKQDVLVERELHRKLGYLQDCERDVWLMDQEINERGVLIDVEFVEAAWKLVQAVVEPLTAEFHQITGVLPTQVAAFKQWLAANGVEVESLSKAAVADLLEDDDDLVGDAGDSRADDMGWLPPQCQRALTIRAQVGSAAVKKLPALAAYAARDGRMRYSMRYHRAGTGRWAGSGPQPQNFPRGAVKADPQVLVDMIKVGDPALLEALFG